MQPSLVALPDWRYLTGGNDAAENIGKDPTRIVLQRFEYAHQFQHVNPPLPPIGRGCPCTALGDSEVLVERLMAEIDRIANTPCPVAQREQRIAKLEEEIDRLQRTQEAIVVSTGAPRERGCPPWVVLGVKVVEAPGVRAA